MSKEEIVYTIIVCILSSCVILLNITCYFLRKSLDDYSFVLKKSELRNRRFSDLLRYTVSLIKDESKKSEMIEILEKLLMTDEVKL